MSKRRKIIIALCVLTVGVLVIGVLIIGALGYVLFSSRGGDTEMVFAPTEVGAPEGPHVTKNIGPAGGTLASPDGRLTLTVPQNALTETVAFSIQPITNKAGQGLGLAYRLEPSGKTFTTPLEISVRYGDGDLEGTVPEALSIAYQDEKGAWRAQKSAKLDQAAKTLTIATTHFTDFAFLARLRMSPPQATLHIGASQYIELVQCKEPGFWDKILSRPLDCSASPPGKVSWGVRGSGSLVNKHTTGVFYTAPAKKPTDNIAFVDLTIDFDLRNPDTGATSKERRTFTTKITIINQGYRATGQDGPTVYSGVICRLDDPFTVTANNTLVSFPLKFVPSSVWAGTFSYSTEWKSLSMVGGGAYRVKGLDTDKPWIICQVDSTLSGPGASSSGIGPAHIDLVPLETDECNEK
jgi:hypothetical protein